MSSTTIRTSPKPRRRVLAMFGASNVFSFDQGVRPDDYLTEQLAGLLRQQGVDIIGRNFGLSGDVTSANGTMPGMTARVTLLHPTFTSPQTGELVTGYGKEVPDLVYLASADDVTQGPVQPPFTLTASSGTPTVTSGNHKYAIGYVVGGTEYLTVPRQTAGGSAILVGTIPRGNRSVTAVNLWRTTAADLNTFRLVSPVALTDVSYLDTMADSVLSSQPIFSGVACQQLTDATATSPNPYPIVTTWNLQWIIQRLLDAGCQKIIHIQGRQFLNYSDVTKADSVAGPATRGLATQIANLAVHDATKPVCPYLGPATDPKDGLNVFDPTKVLLWRNWDDFRDVILQQQHITFRGVTYQFPGIGNSQSMPQYTDGNGQAGFSWHVADTNEHHNPLGHRIAALKVLALMLGTPSQPAPGDGTKNWVTDLKS